jgi:uncharacterized protein (TIGR02001 family)
MRKTLIALSTAVAVGTPIIAAAQQAATTTPPPYTFTANVALASEYLYRGIAQTRGKPAIQGGFDFAHSSGFYIGTWESNISWISDFSPTTSASLEADIYGGYKHSFANDFGFDVGVLTYNYPGKNMPDPKPDTTEVYGALSWKWLSLKYSYATTNLFGVSDSKGSDYIDLSGNYDLGSGFSLIGHVGHQTVHNFGDASYTDWKIGASKDFGVGVLGLYYSDTNAKGSCDAGEPYCFVNGAGDGYNAGKGRVVVTFGKTF